MGNRNILLHFANRELNKTTSNNFSSRRHSEFIKLAATMTSGRICAPFSQVHEQYSNSREIQSLVSALCAVEKLILHNDARDVYQFRQTRADLYGTVREKYPFYFSRTPLAHEIDYRRIVGRSSTIAIKDTLRSTIVGGNIPNFIAAMEVQRIQRHSDFIRRTLDVESIGATFSVYEEHPIEPKPAEVIFLGEISTRVYVRHQTSMTDSVVMTGVYNDDAIEDFDLYPVYDATVHKAIMRELGWAAIIDDQKDTIIISALVGDRSFTDFAELRARFIRGVYSALLKQRRCERYPPFTVVGSVMEAARGLDNSLALPDLANGAALFARMNRLVSSARSRLSNFAEEYERLDTPMNGRREQLVAIHVATDLEEEVARELLAVYGWTYVETPRAGRVSYNRYVNGGKCEVVLFRSAAGTSGPHGSLAVSSDLIEGVKPGKLISVGICFGTDPEKQALCDVIVSQRVAHYESARINDDGTTTYRGDKASTDGEIVSRAWGLRAERRPYNVHVGNTLSGDKLIDNKEFRDKLFAFEEKAIGGDMEAAGLSVTCGQRGVGFAMIKGIADFAEVKDKKRQREAAENAFKFTLEIISGGFS